MDDRIHVPLQLEGFAVHRSELRDGFLEIEVTSTRRPECHHCGSQDVRSHQRKRRRIRDRACGHPTVLVWLQRRVKCRSCKRTSAERHPGVCGRRAVTKRFERHLNERAKARALSDVAVHENVSYYRVQDAFDRESIKQLAHPIDHPIRVLSIDESAFTKRLRYHTILFDIEREGAFDLTEGRNQGAALAGLDRLSEQVKEGIEVVVTDLNWGYRKAVEKALPTALHVADKFHVLLAISKAANRVRRRCGRRKSIAGPKGGTQRKKHPRFDKQIIVTKWMFMKSRHALDDDERNALEALFARYPEIAVAWWMRQAFAAIYEASDRAEAERRLDVWISNLAAANIPELTIKWRALSRWREQILNYFDARYTNALAEGLINKIKLVKRIAYGFRNPERYRRKVLSVCGCRRS